MSYQFQTTLINLLNLMSNCWETLELSSVIFTIKQTGFTLCRIYLHFTVQDGLKSVMKCSILGQLDGQYVQMSFKQPPNNIINRKDFVRISCNNLHKIEVKRFWYTIKCNINTLSDMNIIKGIVIKVLVYLYQQTSCKIFIILAYFKVVKNYCIFKLFIERLDLIRYCYEPQNGSSVQS